MTSAETSLCLEIILQAMASDPLYPWDEQSRQHGERVRLGGNRFSCPSKIEQSLSSMFFILLQSMIIPFSY